MSVPVLLWTALNMHFAARPGRRRQLFSTLMQGGFAAGRCDLPEPFSSELHPGWEEAASPRELERARERGARVVTPDDGEYPPLLRVASDPPWVLYVKGRLGPRDSLAISVVGSRRATPHGLRTARALGRDFAASGFTVVSGLARGIDAAGHRGALEGGGRTLAVLGAGLDRIYPDEHRLLAESIAGSGAVVSEFPFGTAPLQRHFPERNRIIAALSWATVVVEAARDSGSLITADLAADEGRAVYAVPGAVGEPNAEGTNALLRAGALLCRRASDVVEDLAPQIAEAAAAGAAPPGGMPAGEAPAGGGESASRGPAGLSRAQHHVLASVPKTRGIGIERLGELCGMPPGELLAALLELELRGLVQQLPGRRFTSAACKI